MVYLAHNPSPIIIVSRQLFNQWATNPKNGMLITGYAMEHTLAKEIMSQLKEVVTTEG